MTLVSRSRVPAHLDTHHRGFRCKHSIVYDYSADQVEMSGWGIHKVESVHITPHSNLQRPHLSV